MLADPNITTLLGGAILGIFVGLATILVRIVVQVLIGLVLLALVFFSYKQGIVGVERLLSSVVEHIAIHQRFILGLVLGVSAVIHFHNLLRRK